MSSRKCTRKDLTRITAKRDFSAAQKPTTHNIYYKAAGFLDLVSANTTLGHYTTAAPFAYSGHIFD